MKSTSVLLPEESSAIALIDAAPAVGHGIVSRTLLATPELRVVVFRFAAGQELTEHTSTSRALVQILGGECDFAVAGETRRLKTGDMLHLPPRLAHAVKAATALTMLLTLAPPRSGGELAAT